MNKIVITEKAKQSSAIYIYRCPYCGCEIYFTEDDVYDPGRADGEHTLIIFPNCKKETEV